MTQTVPGGLLGTLFQCIKSSFPQYLIHLHHHLKTVWLASCKRRSCWKRWKRIAMKVFVSMGLTEIKSYIHLNLSTNSQFHKASLSWSRRELKYTVKAIPSFTSSEIVSATATSLWNTWHIIHDHFTSGRKYGWLFYLLGTSVGPLRTWHTEKIKNSWYHDGGKFPLQQVENINFNSKNVLCVKFLFICIKYSSNVKLKSQRQGKVNWWGLCLLFFRLNVCISIK